MSQIGVGIFIAGCLSCLIDICRKSDDLREYVVLFIVSVVMMLVGVVLMENGI